MKLFFARTRKEVIASRLTFAHLVYPDDLRPRLIAMVSNEVIEIVEEQKVVTENIEICADHNKLDYQP